MQRSEPSPNMSLAVAVDTTRGVIGGAEDESTEGGAELATNVEADATLRGAGHC